MDSAEYRVNLFVFHTVAVDVNSILKSESLVVLL